MSYSFAFTRLAEQDYEDIITYYLQNGGSRYAAEIEKAFYAKIVNACKEPKMYQYSRIERLRKKGIRTIPVANFTIFYLVDDTHHKINIARIRSDRQDNRKLKV